MKNQRNFEASINALTTFDQRRLIRQQVRAGLLVAPVKGVKIRGGKDDKGKLWDSGDEESSSDEDFHWLQKRMADEEGELDDETMRLLRGVVTEFYKDRKHPELYDRPLDIADSDDDGNGNGNGEDEEESEFDLGKAGRDNFIRPGN